MSSADSVYLITTVHAGKFLLHMLKRATGIQSINISDILIWLNLWDNISGAALLVLFMGEESVFFLFFICDIDIFLS